jgi:hypothetical protein
VERDRHAQARLHRQLLAIAKADELGCVNPEFSELPRGEPSFRVIDRTDATA